LTSALEAGDPRRLARLLAGMFEEPFLYGISSAQLGRDAGCAPFIRMKTVEELLALAESLGLVRTETPEQGVLGYALSEGLPKIVMQLEEHLKISLNFPNIGAAYGLKLGDALITPEAPEHVYVASRIRDVIRQRFGDENVQLRIAEIGAGFGGTAYWLNKLNPRSIQNYTIIDLPLMNACQSYFLGKAFGEGAVRLYGEAEPRGPFSIIPPQAKSQVSETFHVLLNENSMPEMSESVVTDYLTWARTQVSDVFYSYNQEAYSPVDGVPQTWVPKILEKIGGYRRLSRNYSWVRRGYVEEIYCLNR
jgi:hypothetical protein